MEPNGKSRLSYRENIFKLWEELGIPRSYIEERRMPLFEEPDELLAVGPDIYGRNQRLTPLASERWRAMRRAAEESGVALILVSAFRSVAYQADIIRRKITEGTPMADILRVNAAPGCSEHHTGRAIDITSVDCSPLSEAFATTSAYDWLQLNAAQFGFFMTFPAGNSFGIIYEPWHWALRQSG